MEHVGAGRTHWRAVGCWRWLATLALLAGLLVGWLPGAGGALAASVTIDTTPQNRSVIYFGVGGTATPTYGQTIVSPTEQTLRSFTFLIQLPTAVIFRGEVYAWDGTKATGAALYQSGPRQTTDPAVFEAITFDTGGVALAAGASYVLLATTLRDTSPAGRGAFGARGDNPYTGGTYVYQNNPSVLTPWDGTNGGVFGPAVDLAFVAVFDAKPTLTLAAAAPASIPAGSPDTVITLTGASFGPGSVAYLDGVALATTYVNATQLTAVVPAARLAAAGQYPLNVVNPAPDGGTSNTVTLTVTNPVPTLTGRAPTGATAGAGDTALTLTGTGFAPGATIDFGGATLTPTAGNISATTIVVTVPANLLTTARVVAVTVTNPGPGGGTSGALTFTIAAPAPGTPQASLAPTSLAFGARQVGTASDSQQATLTNGGGSPLTIAGVTLTGAHPGDFAVTFNTCAGSAPAGGSCVVGVRFAPTAAGDRAATLQIADNAAGSPQTVALSGTGTGTAPPARPISQAVVTASATGQGSVTPAGSTSYATGSAATYAAVPAAGQTFTGWTLDGRYVGYASPLTFTVNGTRTLVATFVATPSFSDIGSLGAADQRMIAFLAALGIVNPQGVNGSGQFRPTADVKRAEAAAFVARVFGWQKEFHANTFPDKCDPANTGNCIDDELWDNVAALKDYGIVGGYTDSATCTGAGTTAPCYLPRDVVQRVQVVSIVARAFTRTPDLRPTGFWDRLPGNPNQYTDVPDTGTQRSDLTTYRANVGTVPGQTSDATFGNPSGNGSRLYVIQVLYAAFNAQFGTDRVP